MAQEEIGLQHYLEIVWRRKWAIVVVFVGMITLSFIGIALSEPTYKAHSKVAVKNQYYYRPAIMSFAEGTEAPSTSLSGETYQEIINGLPFSITVQDHLLKQGHPMDSGQIHGALRAEYLEPDLIKIHATSKEPDKVLLIANAAAEVFVEYSKLSIREELRQGRQSAHERQEKARQEAQEAESQIAQFRQELGFIDIDSEMQLLRDKVAKFEESRGEVRTKLEVARAHRRELANLALSGSSGDLYLDDPRIEEYRQLQQAIIEARIKYTDDHPVLKNLVTQVRGIEGRLKEAIARTGSNLTPEAFLTLKEDLAKTEAEIADLQTEIDSWTGQIALVEEQLQSYPKKLGRLQELEAKATTAREMHKTWSGRLDDIDFKSSVVVGNAQIVDRALAAGPTLGKPTMAVLAFMVSLLMGLLAGFLVEFADTTLRSPEEITATLNLGYLGSIVRLREPKVTVFQDGKAQHQAAEAYTRIYSNVKFAEVGSPIRSILVTSARKGEGKSTTLVNLACAIAAAGKRVIIVDADLRNPTTQRLLGVKHAFGLTSALAGEVTLDQAIKPTDHPGVSLLPSGPIPPNPAELLHSTAMKELIRLLETRADLVIFDSPPALLVADAMLLAGELNAAIIVAESGGISRRSVQEVKESLQLAKARILGVILNKVQESPGGYYNYYYSYYRYYRTPEEESEQPATAKGWLKGGFENLRKTMGGRG